MHLNDNISIYHTFVTKGMSHVSRALKFRHETHDSCQTFSLGLKIKIINRIIYSTHFINDWLISHIFKQISVLAYWSFLCWNLKL